MTTAGARTVAPAEASAAHWASDDSAVEHSAVGYWAVGYWAVRQWAVGTMLRPGALATDALHPGALAGRSREG